MAIAYDVNLDLLRILEIACVNGTHQISVRGVSADFRVIKYANTTLIWGSAKPNRIGHFVPVFGTDKISSFIMVFSVILDRLKVQTVTTSMSIVFNAANLGWVGVSLFFEIILMCFIYDY